MNKKKMIMASLAVALLSMGSLRAQNNSSANTMAPTEVYFQEVAVSLYGPGAAAVPFKGGDADWNSKMGYAIGLGGDYTYWFSRNVGIVAGLKLTYMTSSNECSNYSADFSGALSLTNNGSALGLPVNTIADLKGQVGFVNETRTMSFLEIPVRLALTKNDFYLNLGLSMNVALTNYAEYTYDDPVYLIKGLPTMGITLPNVPVRLNDMRSNKLFQNNDSDWPFFVMVSAEAGYKFRLDSRNAISLGLYGRYAFLQNTPDGELQPFNLSNVKVSCAQPSATSMVEKIGYYEFGLRIAYHYGVGKPKDVF